MRLEDILYLIASNWALYIASIIICTIVAWWFFCKKVKNLLDPFFFRVVGAVFANAIPVFLFLCNEIKTEYFVTFLLIEVSYWFGFSRNKSVSKLRTANPDSNKDAYKLFIASMFVIILFRFYFYLNYGIPLLMENRADKYVDASGLGGLDRLTYIMEMFCGIYSFAHLRSRNKRKRFSSIAYLLSFILFSIFEGSRSALLVVLVPLFFYLYYVNKIEISLKSVVLVFVLVLSCSLVVIIIQGGERETALFSLLHRFMMFGDVYYESYGYDAIKSVKINYPIRDLLVNFLAPFRLMDYSAGTDVPASMQVHRFVYPELGDINGGPNNRIPFLYDCMFGRWVGCIMAFGTGVLSSKLMYRTAHKCNNSYIGVAIYASLYTIGAQFCTDPIMAISYLPSFIFGYVFLCFMRMLTK